MNPFSLQAISGYFGPLPYAVATTLWLSILTIVLSTIIGIIGALGRRNENRLLRLLSTAYVEVLRNVPLLVVIYLVFFGLAEVGIRVDNFNSALIALTLNAGAYMTEIFRGGLIAIPRSQYLAALSQGMTRTQLYRYVVLPQVVRIIYAPLGNLFIGIIIGSSLAKVIGVQELASWMFDTGDVSFRYMESFLVAGFVYVGLAQCINIARVLTGRALMRAPEPR